MGNINGAQNHLLKARDLAVKILGGSHTLLASYATQLGHVFSQSGDIDQAIVHHLQGLQIHEASFGANSLEAANNAFYLGECYAEEGICPRRLNWRSVLSKFERALKERRFRLIMTIFLALTIKWLQCAYKIPSMGMPRITMS